jgi:hypothetical protein
MEHDGQKQFHCQGYPSVHEHGQNDWRPIEQGLAQMKSVVEAASNKSEMAITD